MHKKDLNTDLGNQYVREFLVGSCFRIGHKAYWFRAADHENMTVDSVDLLKNDKGFVREQLPLSLLKGFEVFRYPTLGYREVQNDKYGPVVLSINTTRSAQRGLRFDLLKQMALPIFNYIDFGVVDHAYLRCNPDGLRTLYSPKFTSFATGIKRLLAGDIAGFAVNENIAVGISCTRGSDRDYDVYFRDRVVGHITRYGDVSFTNKVVARVNNIRSILK